jgi:hypothetical protein
MSIIPASHSDLFDLPAVWHVATIGPSGEPHVSPVWANFDGTHIRFPHLEIPLIGSRIGGRKGDSIVSPKVPPLLTTLQVRKADVGAIKVGPHRGNVGFARRSDGCHMPNGGQVKQIRMARGDNGHDETLVLPNPA